MALSFEEEFPHQKTKWELRREARAVCERDGHGPYRWGYGYNRNGTVSYMRVCFQCQARDYVDKATHPHCADGACMYDNRPDCCLGAGCPTCETQPCERCGNHQKVQYHHWAPRQLFDDADSWPGSYLCQPCHALWHRVVTPHMNRRIA